MPKKKTVRLIVYNGSIVRIFSLLAKTVTIAIISAPSDRLMMGYENARGTGRVFGSLVKTGTYAPTAIPIAVNNIVRGAARVMSAR